MMSCRKERAVDELYTATRIVMKPEITPVLRGSHRMQGPADETDHDIKKNMVSSQSIKEFGKHSMSRKVHMRGESGACNLCSAPCSSCVHFNRALMGSKADEFSDETCRVNAASQYSINVGDTSASFKSKACDSLQHTTSETSNLLSVNSSHDSLSENAESKAPIRSSDTSDAVEGFEMLTNTFEDSKVVEVNDDNISCISRVNDANLAVNHHNRNVERKNLSCSFASVGSVDPEEVEKAHKSVLSEMVKAADAGDSATKGKLPECSGNMDSSLIKESPSDIVARQKFDSNKGLGASTKICPKKEVETNGNGQDLNDEALKCLDHGEQDVKSNELVAVAEKQPLQSASGDDSDESDIVEHDVKVCDICGDAGREDMLAMCSRCSDGAEHIYCMRKMLRRVPKGQWLCEECKFAEEADNQKQGSDMEGKKMDKAILSTQFSNKRLAENIEVAPAAKRQALEIRVGSPRPSSPKRMGALSRESSFKSIDKERLRSTYQSSQSINDISETARSPSSGIRLQTTKGTLLKSNSFNTLTSKPRVKTVDDVPQKQKGSKEHSSLDMKERVARMMGKSVSFKSANSGRSNVSESKVKMLSSKFSHVQDLKGLKQAKERSTIERKNLSKLDRPLASFPAASPIVSTPKIDPASRGETSLLSSVSNNRESKVVLPDGKLSTVTKSIGNLTRKGVEPQNASVGGSSTNGICNSASEQKSNQVSSKDEPLSSYSGIVEKPCSNVDETLEDAFPQSVEMTSQADKTRESSARCRPTVAASPKCKDIGHTAEFCRVGISQTSGTDASTPISSREDMPRGNRLKDAIHAALLRKPEIYRKKRVFDPSDELSTSNVDLSYEVASQEQSLISNKLNNITCSEGSHDGQTVLGTSTSDSYKNTTVNNLKQHTVQPIDSVFPSKVTDSVSVVPSLGKSTVKDLHSHASVAMGSFEVQRGGNYLDLCGGVQAHLSTCASPRVLEVVNKFQFKVPLSEVPRLSVWPSHFHQSGAKEDNIALYFFAKDLESYERDYKILLDAMIKNDLALKGNFDGVELLIFPSNQLPERSQRWNMLFFLWGVFRTTRVHRLDFTKETCVPSLSNSLDKYGTLSENLCIPKHIDEFSASDKCRDVASAANSLLHMGPTVSKDHVSKDTYPEEVRSGSKVSLVVQDSRLDSNTTKNAGLSEGVPCTAPLQQEICLRGSGLGTEIKSSIPITGSNSSNKGEKRQVHWVTSGDREGAEYLKIRPISNQEVAIAGSVGEETIPDRKKRVGLAGGVEEVILDGVNIESVECKQDKELKRDYGYKEIEAALVRDLTAGVNSFQSSKRKHPHIALSETAASAATNQEMSWNEVNSTQIDGEGDSKKPKIGSSGLYGCSTSRGTNAVDDGFVPHNDMGPCSMVEKRCVEACEEKVIPEDLGTTERYFFPVDSRHVQHFHTVENSVPWKGSSSGDEDKSRDGFPSLELALGAETKPQNKGILPFFVGLADEKNNQDKPLDAVVDEKDDDASASLSLSLSFPFPDKEQPVKPVSKSEQLLPERHHVNTSLLLFGRLPDK
ncbi:hypothetical protein PRUPE_2G329000 [Prunus persica]|uniref:Zinc finger PHD-type domain-containing protein n=3 Tax=Prunus persica TaxID=3760 RepID=A0A251QTE1_PRUPE|nr:uncharacterized protein LOC18787726 isoform X3 [Prunus persica]ONI25965.1 hypothetical protein PRUPE_2G329000 [Prunus persica]